MSDCLQQKPLRMGSSWVLTWASTSSISSGIDGPPVQPPELFVSIPISGLFYLSSGFRSVITPVVDSARGEQQLAVCSLKTTLGPAELSGGRSAVRNSRPEPLPFPTSWWCWCFRESAEAKTPKWAGNSQHKAPPPCPAAGLLLRCPALPASGWALQVGAWGKVFGVRACGLRVGIAHALPPGGARGWASVLEVRKLSCSRKSFRQFSRWKSLPRYGDL